MTEFTIYSTGLFYLSVCTSLDDDTATARANQENLAGTSNGWQIADEPFADGTPNPTLCHDHPDTHRHLLFAC